MPERLIPALEELIAKLPKELQPWAQKYAPWLLGLAYDDAVAWIERLAAGDIEGAYRSVVESMDSAALLAEFNTLLEEWKEANRENAQRMAVAREARAALLRILLGIVLVAVGL